MSTINRFTPILWTPLESWEPTRLRDKNWLLLGRFTEQFWRNLSLKTQEFQVTHFISAKELGVTSCTRVFKCRDYAMMGIEITICLLIIPLVVMLAAKFLVRSHYQFTINHFNSLNQCHDLEGFRLICSQLDFGSPQNVQQVSNLLFHTMERRENRSQFLKIIIDRLALAGRSDLLGAYDSKGLTPLHYAHLYHDEEAIQMLEAADKEGVLGQQASEKPFMLDFTINWGWGVERGFPHIPAGMTAKEMVQYSDHLAARQILCEYMVGDKISIKNSPIHPWPTVIPSLDVLVSYLDPKRLNEPDAYGRTLLHYAKLYRWKEIEDLLIQAGADRTVKSRDMDIHISKKDTGIHEAFRHVGLGGQYIQVQEGLAADEFAASYWDQFYWMLALVHIKGTSIIDSRGNSLICCPHWKTHEGGDFRKVISHITTLDRQDKHGLTLMHYAMLFDQRQMQEQLKERSQEMRVNLNCATEISCEWQMGWFTFTSGSGRKGLMVTPEEIQDYCVDKILFSALYTRMSNRSLWVLQNPSTNTADDLAHNLRPHLMKLVKKRLVQKGFLQAPIHDTEIDNGAITGQIQKTFEGSIIKLLKCISNWTRYPGDATAIFTHIFSANTRGVNFKLANALLKRGVDPIDRESPDNLPNSRTVKRIFELGTGDLIEKDKRKELELRSRIKKVIQDPIASTISALPLELVTIISQYAGWEPELGAKPQKEDPHMYTGPTVTVYFDDEFLAELA